MGTTTNTYRCSHPSKGSCSLPSHTLNSNSTASIYSTVRIKAICMVRSLLPPSAESMKDWRVNFVAVAVAVNWRCCQGQGKKQLGHIQNHLHEFPAILDAGVEASHSFTNHEKGIHDIHTVVCRYVGNLPSQVVYLPSHSPPDTTVYICP